MPRLFALAVLFVAAGSVSADRIGPPPVRPVVAVISSDVVATGTVTEVEDDTVKAKPHPDAKDEIEYKVLVVKITDPLLGIKNQTHLRVGVPTVVFNQPNQPLQKDGKYLLYLTKHSTSTLLLPNAGHQPVNLAGRGADEQLRLAKAAAAAIADPVKALKAKEKDDRTLAACALAMYYRKVPPNAKGTEGVARPEEESKLLLTALAEGEWTLTGTPESGNPYSVVFGLGLEDDGWKAVATIGRQDPAAVNKEAFTEWLAGKGKDARVKQLVAKK